MSSALKPLKILKQQLYNTLLFINDHPLMAQTVPQRAMSVQSRLIGMHYQRMATATIANKPEEVKQIVEEEEDLVRKKYCEIFDIQEAKHKDDPAWWKTEFENAGKLLVDSFEKGDESQDNTIALAYNGQPYEFINKRVLTIGVRPECDIRLTLLGNGSRLHALVFLFPESGKYVVADMGSMKGIITEKRSTQKACKSSLPNGRNIMIFDWGETAILLMGNHKVGINPKECLICLMLPRNCTFDCGHFVVCMSCKGLVQQCPLCKKPIKKIELGLRMETFMASK